MHLFQNEQHGHPILSGLQVVLVVISIGEQLQLVSQVLLCQPENGHILLLSEMQATSVWFMLMVKWSVQKHIQEL